MAETVVFKRVDRVAVLTLNRPEKLNALNYALNDRLLRLLDELEPDDRIGAVVLTGAGERAFSAGADIHEFAADVRAGPDTALRAFLRRGQAMTARLEAYPKPVIAAVNGIAFGGGCEIVEGVHLTVASERASFAKPEIAIGMLPTFGGTQRLPRLAGRKRALELLLTGEPFSPERAFELGLVNRIVPHEDLLPAALTLARDILRHSPEAIARTIAAVVRGIDLPVAEGLRIEADQFARVAATAALGKALERWTARSRAAAANGRAATTASPRS